MPLALPREAAIAICLIAAQLIYSRLYPWFSAPGQAELHPKPAAPSTFWAQPASQQEGRPVPAPTHTGRDAAADSEPEGGEQAEHFAASTTVRSRRKAQPKFRVGQVVRDQILFIRGVVVGWDETCRAPVWWRRARLASQDWEGRPHYLVLGDIRDLSEDAAGAGQTAVNATFYAPEATLERAAKGTAPLLSPLMPQYFSLFEAASDMYIPQPHLARLYPDDVHRHYLADPDRLPDSDPKGGPLLRVVEHGRLIGHGAPVPVVRKGMFLVASEEVPGDMFARSVVLLLEHDDKDGTLGLIVNKNATDAERKLHLKAGGLAVEQMTTRLQQLQRQAAAQPDVDDRPLRQLAEHIERGEALLQVARAPGVELRIGGPVGLEGFPVGPHHLVLHPFKDIRGSQLALAGSGALEDVDLYYCRPALMRTRDIEALAKRARGLAPVLREAGQRVLIFRGNSAWGPKQLAGEIRGALHGGPSWAWLPASPRDVLALDATRAAAAPAAGAGLLFWRRLANSTAAQRLVPS